MSKKNIAFAVVALLGFLADQGTKAWVVANIEYQRGEIHLIEGWLSLVHERNTGAAFSSFEGMFWLFVVFTVIAVGVLLDMQRRLRPDAVAMSGTLGLILSGALGNFIDRLRFQYVTDFVKCYTEYPPIRDWLIEKVGTNVYPIWNIADAAILVGVALFLLHSVFLEDEDVEEANADVPDEAPAAT